MYSGNNRDIKHSIVLVDDHIDVSNMLVGYFSLAKFKVLKAISAEECLEKLKESDSKVDVVLVNGTVAADRGPMLVVNIKKLNSKIKVFALAEDDTNKTRVLEYGADEFTTKPISPTTIVEKVSGLLMKKPAESER